LLAWALATLAFAACSDSAPSERCAPEGEVTTRPRSIAEAVALVNALPRPATIECFVESLDRPLYVEATSSIISAQPAAGRRSPRVFLFAEPLVMSITMDGDGRDLLEFGEFVDERQTIKAEIAFPVVAEVEATAPFDRVLFDDEGPDTSCALCHRDERASGDIPGAFVSDALRPADDTLVDLLDLQREADRCDPGREPARCAQLDAFTGHGELVHRAFPPELPTIFD